jgi:hypothetical protein
MTSRKSKVAGIYNYLRMAQWGLMALGAYLLLHKPELQGEVIIYKAVLIMGAAHLGYWIDRSLFHYARPHMLVDDGANFRASMIRRAIIVAAVILALALAL